VRGIKDHKFVSPLAFPGETDLSVDVDFSQLRAAAQTAGGVCVSGPVPQGEFLQRLGIVERLQQVLDSEAVSEEDKEAVMSQVERLVAPDAMGDIYKVMAITSEALLQEEANVDDGVPGFPDAVQGGGMGLVQR
jgi:NADH dehydrogenase [ubiquinone] 1 alpha subcomplex assembly factor 7